MRITIVTPRAPTPGVGRPARAGPARPPRVEVRSGVIHVAFPAPPASRRGAPRVASTGTALWRLGPWTTARPWP